MDCMHKLQNRDLLFTIYTCYAQSVADMRNPGIVLRKPWIHAWFVCAISRLPLIVLTYNLLAYLVINVQLYMYNEGTTVVSTIRTPEPGRAVERRLVGIIKSGSIVPSIPEY